jgi:hypothetical protein
LWLAIGCQIGNICAVFFRFSFISLAYSLNGLILGTLFG